MAVQIKIPGMTFTNASALPLVRADSMLSPGTLVLLDANHPAAPFPAGVPAHGAALPNIAWPYAKAMIGAGDVDTLAASVYSVGMTSTAGLVERTVKGGVHAIISPTTAFTDATVGFNIGIAQAIYDYMRANPSHKYYGSIWFRVTRAANHASAVLFSTINADSTFAMTFSHISNLSQPLVPPVGKDGEAAIDDTVGGPRFRNMANTPGPAFGSDTIANNTNFPPGFRSAFLVGNRHNVNGTSSSGGRRGKGGSRVFYRYTLEDLTVSGRTYAEMNALDAALFAAQMNTAGGRYYGDTIPTDPATIP